MSEPTDERDTKAATFFNVVLWLFQLLLASAFGISGVLKVAMPIPELIEVMTWAENLPAWLMRVIGVSEILGAAGLILPGVTRVKPTALTVLAAGGLAVVMVLAALFHLWRLEFFYLPANLILGGLAVFIVWGRRNKARLHSEG